MSCEFAYKYALDKHKGQTRKHGESYIEHPLRVYEILKDYVGVEDTDILEAALLHDVVEDSGVTLEELSKYFNYRVVSLVGGLSRCSYKNSKEYIRTIKGDRDLTIIKFADRLSNLEDLSLQGDVGFIIRYLQNTKENYLDMEVPDELRLYMEELIQSLE